MFSDALPPARNRQRSDRAHLSQGCLVFTLLLLTTACGVGNSATVAGSQPAQEPPAATPVTHNLLLSGVLPPAEVGMSYLATFSVDGGKGPYQFSLGWGQLPNGLILGAASGTLSGKPSKAGTFNFGIRVQDASGKEGAHPFQTAVLENTGAGIVVNVTPGTATVPSTGSMQFSALVSNTSDVAVKWSASDGTISSTGMYKSPTVSSKTTATVTATSSADPTKSGSATVSIMTGQSNAVSITTTSLSSATAGTSYSDPLAASGGKTPYTWSVASGQLPSGVTLQASGTLSGTTTQTGQFTFTAQVADSSSPQQSATQSLALTVSNATVNGGTISQSFFGAGFNGSKVWPPTDGAGQQATLGGIRLWDDGVKWGQINTSSNVYEWTGLDGWLDRAASANVDVLYTFGDTPQFIAGPNAPKGCVAPGAFSCSAPTDVNSDGTGTDSTFQAFVTALVTHAAGRISYYEQWNEPDCSCFWSGTQAQLVRMGKDAAAIIRSLDPSAKILSPSAHGPTMATWFDDYVAAGGVPNFDIVNVHMRGENGTNASPEAFLTVWGQVQTEVAKRSLTALPIWDDEHGILQDQGLTDPDMLDGYVARSIMLRAGVGIQRQYVYTWDSKAPYGLQGNGSGTAWNEAAGWLIGHSMSACTASGTVYTCELDNAQVVWDTAQSCTNGICTTSNYTYPSTYIWHTNLAGNRLALTGKTVAIGYKPILLDSQ